MFSVTILAAPALQAEVVHYELDNLILDDNNAQMFGTFTWTYDVGDFENGVGQFTFLDIPYTAHDHTDLDASFDVDNSIEITLEGSVHDDGVDITLFLVQPLTPTSGSAIDLNESRFEIGGNGFHDGFFLSGSVVLAGATSVDDRTTPPDSEAAMRLGKLTTYPNPFNPQTRLEFELDRDLSLRLEVFDLHGRLVRRLAQGVRPAGTHAVSWDGTDSNGQSVPSGRYVARLSTRDAIVTRSMMLVR